MPWKRSSYIASTPVVANARTYLKLKGPEFKARKEQQKGKGREWICLNTHGSLTEKLHFVTKQVNGTYMFKLSILKHFIIKMFTIL